MKVDTKERYKLQRTGLFGFSESGILLALLVLLIFMSIATRTFLSPYNLAVVLRQVSFIGIVAIGQTLVLLMGGIDLSVGSIAGLTSILGVLLMTSLHLDPFLATFLAMLIGLFFGIINGTMIAKFKLNAFIVTLATGEIFAGLILVLTKGYSITNLPTSFAVLGQGMLGPVPVPIVIFFVISLLFITILKMTPFGRSIYAIGGNREAARLVGLKVDRVEILVYGLSGLLAAVAGMLLASRMNAGQPTTGASWLMPSITAAIIGGTSLSGGVGTILGTILGATFMGILANGIVLLSISSYWERVIIGAVVIVAVIIDMIRRHREGGMIKVPFLDIGRVVKSKE